VMHVEVEVEVDVETGHRFVSFVEPRARLSSQYLYYPFIVRVSKELTSGLQSISLVAFTVCVRPV
jgi:hypothetical protein